MYLPGLNPAMVFAGCAGSSPVASSRGFTLFDLENKSMLIYSVKAARPADNRVEWIRIPYDWPKTRTLNSRALMLKTEIRNITEWLGGSLERSCGISRCAFESHVFRLGLLVYPRKYNLYIDNIYIMWFNLVDCGYYVFVWLYISVDYVDATGKTSHEFLSEINLSYQRS